MFCNMKDKNVHPHQSRGGWVVSLKQNPLYLSLTVEILQGCKD